MAQMLDSEQPPKIKIIKTFGVLGHLHEEYVQKFTEKYKGRILEITSAIIPEGPDMMLLTMITYY